MCIRDRCYAGFEAVLVIKPKDSYSNYSEGDLKKRIWELEKAVFQLQQKVFALEVGSSNGAVSSKDKITCYMSVFGDTFTATEDTETKAKATVLSECSKKTNAIHCHDNSVKCGK